MITAEEARKNLPSEDEILEKYLTEEIESKIRDASTRKTKTNFGIHEVEKDKWELDILPNIEKCGNRQFDGVKFTSKVIEVLKENGYKVEMKEYQRRYETLFKEGDLVVSWGEE